MKGIRHLAVFKKSGKDEEFTFASDEKGNVMMSLLSTESIQSYIRCIKTEGFQLVEVVPYLPIV